MQAALRKLKVLFLCTGNSCRSQMAEGWARALKGDVVEACSAGIENHGLNPHAVKVMAEAGIDISRQHSKTLAEISARELDCVVTVCGHAQEHCPVFPGQTRVVHVGFEDPPTLTKHLPDGEEKLAVYRRVRDQIRRFVETLPASLDAESLFMSKTKVTNEAEAVRAAVREGYGEIAKKDTSCSSGVSCCGSNAEDATQLAQYVGYSAEELAALPEGANMGLSCGNPTALASLKPGEVVLDLGAGGGFDVFIAARKVGAMGLAIGVDMTPEMLAKARKNIAAYRQHSGLDNVEFRLGEIEHLPVADNSVDTVISNCVINLSPDKTQVWREIARVLKPGGRVAVSDMALLRPLPAQVAELVEALVGCVAGAVLASETERMAGEAGLTNIRLNPKKGYVAAMTDWKDPLYNKIVKHLPAGSGPEDYITSLEVIAVKPVSKAKSRQ
jgi:thioredoxin type arsenate reductase